MAIDMLFKVFWNFNMHYPAILEHTYDFMEIIFGLKTTGKSAKVDSQARNLTANLLRKLQSLGSQFIDIFFCKVKLKLD